MSYEPVRCGELAAVVTFLEMRSQAPADAPPSPLALQRIEKPQPSVYRELFRLVGAPWLWFSRLILDDPSLRAIIHDPRVELFTVVGERDGPPLGMMELDFRQPGACELSFIGFVVELCGKGHGSWLLNEAIRRAWRGDIARVHVHTCSLDHPAALTAYTRAGFVPVSRAIERFPDPRLLGVLPRDCAPRIPLIEP